MKNYINNYINFYLENDDELTTKNKDKFRRIQNNKDTMNNLSKKLEKLNLKDMQDVNYTINELLEKEV